MEQLPNEILIRILRFLNIYDLLQFCEVFKDLDYFLRDKDVISYTDWSKRFEIHNMNLCKFISMKMNPNCIKILKINGIYWIPAHDLRKLLTKLPALEELHAVDTKLGFRSKDVVEYFKLKKLAVSVEDDHFEYETVMASENLKLLKHLYLKILLKKEDHREIATGLRLFFCKLKHLVELWIQDDHESLYRINYERLVVQLKNLQKFVLRSKSVLPMYDFSFVGLTKTFECRRCNTEGELIFERILNRKSSTKKSIFEPKESDIEKAWDVFESLHADLPCGPKEYKLLSIREELENIHFEELHFCHTVILCNSKYVDAALQILKTNNCRSLKKLNFRSCLFQDFFRTQKREGDILIFKKPRIGVKTDILSHPFHKVATNLKNLVELEIYNCPGCNSGAVISAYHLIANFKKLEKLNLEIPLLLDGSFLEQLFKNCLKLENLNLTITSTNETFLKNLYEKLPNAAALKHFRLVCPRVNIEKLFLGLNQIVERRLLRIFIKCDSINYSTTSNERELFSSFLETHPQLVFFVLLINQATAKQVSDINKIIYEYKKRNTAKIFYCKKEIDPLTGVFPIPSAHRDIIFNRTEVGVIDFDKF
ncbi:unnamed protein product [Psylliodes chrysocephalus]|uniref:F-box domain-containing protein n=1 Tax=Psylliodes chrysocephalus TaxID=3402493 RepID=A0A9P0CGW0_9CUCU|nr:unnamed protein product [Psylliodes chrysocephala]